MKKRISFLFSLFLLTGLPFNAGFARNVTSPESVIAANNHLSSKNTASGFSIIRQLPVEVQGNTIAFVFELNPAGYLVVSALTELPPIIAYSFDSNFGEMNAANPLYSLIVNDLSIKIAKSPERSPEWVEKNEMLWSEILSINQEISDDRLFEQWPASGDGWLKTNWTQNAPYNNFCPMDPVTGTRSYAGCPATAMAQIMNFHSTTNGTHFSDEDDYYHNYAGRQYWIDNDYEYADFPSFPELNASLDSLSEHYLNSSALTNDDKAALTFACGVAARQVFTSQGSGTFGVDQAYSAYLRFGCSSVELLDTSDADLFGRMMQNIKDTLPVHLAIVDESWSTGHNVVVDGYNTDDYYHLNFGWGGPYNGWYLIPSEIPYELTVIEGVVIDIQKSTPTGTKELSSSLKDLKIFPNPFRNEAYVYYNLDKIEDVNFQLFNISGAVIREYQLPDQATGEHSIKLILNNLSPGFYFYSLTAGTGFYTGRLIKAH